jgi:hypothetical protein
MSGSRGFGNYHLNIKLVLSMLSKFDWTEVLLFSSKYIGKYKPLFSFQDNPWPMFHRIHRVKKMKKSAWTDTKMEEQIMEVLIIAYLSPWYLSWGHQLT